jgi:hypothetical protein
LDIVPLPVLQTEGFGGMSGGSQDSAKRDK